MERAKVWFVGAGCGAPDLITVRGMNLLKAADMVIYAGSLVNPELLRYTREGCEIFDSAYMDLEEVLEKFREGAEKGLTMVRLHTGDPSVYGAIKEQMDALDDMGIPYESCPGVSACFGAAASLDLEYTLPGISQSLIITRMAGRTGVPEKESIESFASHDSTMAIYLSAGSLGELSGRLIAGGYSPDTPAALVYKATWPDEKKFICTVSELERVASENGIRKTAIVLVGRAIASNNYEKSKLYDRTFTTEFREGKE
ncbi:MAG: precorrin-4 C(11)-methyltransferase [Eubacterium sp.]|nr:precorrin-4 C(11)-methyltransferase [Eubacterium sp.]